METQMGTEMMASEAVSRRRGGDTGTHGCTHGTAASVHSQHPVSLQSGLVRNVGARLPQVGR